MNFNELVKKVKADPALLKKANEAKSIDELVGLAKEQGVSVTSDEVREYIAAETGFANCDTHQCNKN